MKNSETLAIDGGRPIRCEPLPSWPTFDKASIEAAAAVLRSGKVNYWTGDEGRRFEREFADRVGCRHAVAVANGTLALETALAACEIGPGDEVIVTARSFIASAGCCVARGAVPVFADVDPVSQNITPETIQAALSEKTKAIIAVHLAGWPCDMGPITRLAEEHGLWVIEDAAQALGANYRGAPVGSLGHIAAFSFCQDKILTTGGEGGMVATNDRGLWRRAFAYKDHGKDYDAMERPSQHVFRWLHESHGTNARMTEMQAAVGRTQLAQLDLWLAARRRNAELLAEQLAGLPALRLAMPPAEVDHAWYKFYAFVQTERLPADWTRDRIVRAIGAEGVPCGSGVCPEIYLEKAFENTPLRPTWRLPVAGQLGKTSLMLHVHPTLSPRDMLDTAEAVKKVLRAASGAVPTTTRRAA